jgi:RNA polymerase sigma factor (sigma-70 family)
MITYTPEQRARLRRDPLAELDAEHEAIVELLSAPPTERQDINSCLRSRSRWRRLDAIRSQRDLLSVPTDSPRTADQNDPAAVVERAETREQVARALDSLPEGDRSILHARFFEGQRLQDVACDCGCTVQSAHTREKRALKHLQPLLAFLVKE